MIPAAADVALPSICASTTVTATLFLLNTYAAVAPTIPAPIITTFFIPYTFFFNKNFYQPCFRTIFYHIMRSEERRVGKECSIGCSLERLSKDVTKTRQAEDND